MMCRNYDGGPCEEPGCAGRVTCHDFTDQRCVEHSYNGRTGVLDEDDDEPEQPASSGRSSRVDTRCGAWGSGITTPCDLPVGHEGWHSYSDEDGECARWRFTREEDLSRVGAPDPAAVMAAHEVDRWVDYTGATHEECKVCRIEFDDWQVGDFPMGSVGWPCETWLLADELKRAQAEAERLADKVARVEALPDGWDRIVGGRESRDRADDLRAALADQTERD